ncbi:hypothetical protein HMPREF0666_01677 [Prevotella sp. C561]|uniref:hypothetical protein n=1 Tax=Prevotella sp. C561 TaxID=563031 RepID=UPI0002238BD1|nr:hypothetical protein [Prevotella sp. C561]EGW47104.1 hypothetical protein HMPREF0666_01677 [Prevotella sp. C561]
MNRILRFVFVAAFTAVSSLSFAQKTVTFELSSAESYKQFGLAGQSSQTSNDGDFTEDKSVTSGDVKLTVSTSGVKTANRMWKGSLRMYGGTLTVESANDNIVKIVYAVSFNNWDESNNVNNQELKMTSEKDGKNVYKFYNWTGVSKKVVLNVKKAFLRSVTITTVSATGIKNVQTIEVNEKAPIYNLAGQRVSKDYKGVVIQNGKKFVRK